MSGGKLRIGTRGSALALWQARRVAARLGELELSLTVELVPIATAGDRLVDVSLTGVEGKAFFTGEIERALTAGEIDLAVHSLKDLATADPPGLTVAAVLEREDPRDVLVARAGIASLGDLPAGSRVGTSSLRRRAMVARLRPDLELAELRGNVPTRLARLDEGRFEAIVVAAAGLKRLALEHRVSAFFPPGQLLPAPGQGALAVQVRADDASLCRLIGRLDDGPSRAATTAERALLARLEGGCLAPVGALASLVGGSLRLDAMVCAPDGRAWVEGRRVGVPTEPAELGRALADELLARGAGALLHQARGSAVGSR